MHSKTKVFLEPYLKCWQLCMMFSDFMAKSANCHSSANVDRSAKAFSWDERWHLVEINYHVRKGQAPVTK